MKWLLLFGVILASGKNFYVWESSINDVTVLGEGGQGICDDSTKAFVIKRVTMGGGGGSKNWQKLRDVIYGQPLE